MKKYVFSSTLNGATWNNSTLVRCDVAAQVAKLKGEQGGDLLLSAHGPLGGTLLKDRLIDVLDLSIHPLVVGHDKLFFRDDRKKVKLKLVAATNFAHIVKLTYEPQYDVTS